MSQHNVDHSNPRSIVYTGPDIVGATMLDGYALEVVLTTANSAAQAWYGYDQVHATST